MVVWYYTPSGRLLMVVWYYACPCTSRENRPQLSKVCGVHAMADVLPYRWISLRMLELRHTERERERFRKHIAVMVKPQSSLLMLGWTMKPVRVLCWLQTTSITQNMAAYTYQCNLFLGILRLNFQHQD